MKQESHEICKDIGVKLLRLLEDELQINDMYEPVIAGGIALLVFKSLFLTGARPEKYREAALMIYEDLLKNIDEYENKEAV